MSLKDDKTESSDYLVLVKPVGHEARFYVTRRMPQKRLSSSSYERARRQWLYFYHNEQFTANVAVKLTSRLSTVTQTKPSYQRVQ